MTTPAFLHPFAAPARTDFTTIVRGEGAIVYDADGKELWLHDALRGHPSVLILGCLT